MPVILRPIFYTITPLEGFLFFPACGQRCGAPGDEIERVFLRAGNDPYLWRYDASVDIGLPPDHRLILEKRVVPIPCLPDGAPRSLPARFSDVMEEYFRFEWPRHHLSVQGIYKNRDFENCRHYARIIFLKPPGPESLEKRSFKLFAPHALSDLCNHVATKVPDVFFRPWS